MDREINGGNAASVAPSEQCGTLRTVWQRSLEHCLEPLLEEG